MQIEIESNMQQLSLFCIAVIIYFSFFYEVYNETST
jgi:hypothetical protein